MQISPRSQILPQAAQLPARPATQPAESAPISSGDALVSAQSGPDYDWKAVGKAALGGAGLGAASSALGALGDGLRAPAAGVRYAAVASAAVVGTRSAEKWFHETEKDGPIQFARALGLGAAGLAGGTLAGGLAGTLGGLAGAVGGWPGIAAATVAGAALAGGAELVRQKLTR